jgi:iron(III) transport system ATP-binding protein
MVDETTDNSDSKVYLQIDRLTKKFGNFVALDSVSLEVYEGEFVCFLGPSGCGKTTLLRAIAGLDIQTSGTVRQADVDISALPPSERDFGIVFQSYALFPNLTAERNIAFGLENQKLEKSAVDKRVNELLDLVGLPDQGPKYPAQLSGGQQQRIALARALATSPGLLLLDEPLSALDAKVRAHLRHEIKDLQRRLGVTTVMVRPGRSADHGRPHRRHEPGRHRAGRHPDSNLPRTRYPVRRRLHRCDEPGRGPHHW